MINSGFSGESFGHRAERRGHLSQCDRHFQIPRWSDAFTYSLPFHYPHDIRYCEAEFDIRGLAAAFDAEPDAFAALGQFITVYPDVDKNLRGILVGIDATHQDGIDDTAVALKSFSARQDART